MTVASRFDLVPVDGGVFLHVDPEAINMGALEDISSGSMRQVMDTLATIIVGGTLGPLAGLNDPESYTAEERAVAVRAALRKMKRAQFQQIDKALEPYFRA